ncbi:FAD-binding oxidoreductase [Nonomuraea sp. NPDC050556]|uniref:FAD-binding oxidoreductase n=1 Tax=Nonomuraea sp. NPDC050556 TaxID=3364369 RepID=UPI00378F8F09
MILLTQQDPGYEDARALHNGMIDRKPAVIARVSSVADVVAALRLAREKGYEVSVRGGGHGVAGKALGGDLVIDLSALRAVTVDERNRTAVVQGGATWSDVDTATQAYGLAVPGGRVSHTGVAGLTLGGGEGWLSALHGLTCDNLIAAELVAADGRHVLVDDARELELMNALRGGGGNFGVVTSFTFRLHPVGPLVLGGMIGFRVCDAPMVLDTLDRLRSRPGFGGAAVFMTAPPAPFVPGDVVGRPILGVVPAYFGDLEVGSQVIRPLRESALFDASAVMPYVALQSMLDEGAPPGLRNRWTGAYVEGLSPGLVTALQDHAVAAPSPLSQIVLSAVSGQWLVHPMACWTDPADDAENIAWVDKLTAAINDHPVTGTYLNMEDPDDDRVRWALRSRYADLQRVKATWDPDDVFRHCAHIRLPS